MRVLAASLFVFALRAAAVCKCESAYTPCDEVRASDLVFIGTADSVQPAFLNRWNLANDSNLRALNKAYLAAEEDPSPSSFAKLVEAYRKAFPDLPSDGEAIAKKPATAEEIASEFYQNLKRGSRVHFKVTTLFKDEDDDDPDKPAAKKPKDHDDDDPPESFDLWTSFGECGFDFQIGETYLVYANQDEGADYFFTSACTRTRRLSDAGDDLAYLLAYKDDPTRARLEGFASFDPSNQMDPNRLGERGAIKAPAAGVIVELKSGGLSRYAESEPNGRFLFDRLPADTYKLSAYDPSFPLTTQPLTGPETFRIAVGSCAHRLLVIPRTASGSR